MKKGSKLLANPFLLLTLASGITVAYSTARREVPSTAPTRGRAKKPSRTGEARA